MPIHHRPSLLAAAFAAAVACMPSHALQPAASPQAPAPVASGAPEAAPARSPLATWSDEVWGAARAGDRRRVETLLAAVPDEPSVPAAARIRASATAREEHLADTARSVAEERAKRTAEFSDALSKDAAVKALVAASYVKFLSDDWRRDSGIPEIRKVLELVDRRVEEAGREGDWLFAEELVSRARGLLDGSGRTDDYGKYDDALETDIGRRVRLVLAYAPRAWYDLRKRQYDRLDEEDRKEPFAPFNAKGSDDWRQSIEGINRDILREALGKIAGQHLEHVGWKPLLEGGLGMLRVLAETPELAESFPGLADREQARRFGEAVRAQWDAVAAMKSAEADARALDRCLDAVMASNAATVRLPEEVLVREFGEGAVGAVGNDFEDPYTEIVWPDRMRRFRQMIDGNFVGVGILIRHNEKRDIVVINPLDGSPAKRAGIKPGDRIVAVNGSSTAEWPLDKAVDTITGPAGSAVKLSVARDGTEGNLDFPLIRERIKMYSVQGWRKAGYTDRLEPRWDWYVDPEDGIAYVRLTGFNEDTFADFLRAMRDIAGQRPLNGLVLDLRGNPGGLLQSAVSFVNAFLRNGRIVSVEDRNGQELYAFAAERHKAPLAGLPTVVLINDSSASASEIVSGALEAHDAAVVIGERSFGKGSVQEVHSIGGRGSAAEANVKYTVQHYLLPPKPGQPKGRLVHKKPGAEDWGVVPDLEVGLSPDQVERINKLRAAADDVPEDAAEGLIESPAGSPPSADGSPVAAKSEPEAPADPADLVRKGIDPQLELAVLLLQARVAGQAQPPDARPAARPAPAAPARS